MATLDAERAQKFWSWFIRHESEISGHENPEAPILDQLLEQMQEVQGELFFEVGTNMSPHELIITAEGKKRLFPLVDELVKTAPSIPGWRIIALKPAQGCDFVTNLNGADYNPRELWFMPLTKKDESGRYLGLRIGVPGLETERIADAKWASLLILDTVLGERAAAEEIHYVDVIKLPADPSEAGFMVLPELPRYIPFWKSRA